MADGKVEYQVRASMEHLDEDLDQANKKVKSGTDELVKTSKKTSLAVGASFLAVGAAAVGIGVEAIKSADEMDKAMNGFLASTGKGIEETEKYQDVLEDIYANNYGDSFEDIANSMSLVTQQMGDLSDEELQLITESAYLLRDTFDIEISESIRGVDRLMNDFGVTGEEAYNLIAQGAQNGLNQNGDLVDQIAEYSTYYSDMGFSVEEMFNAMANGVESGAYQVDYLNDAMKEFGIRSKDGSKASKEAFDSLGLDAEKMTKAFAKGGEDAKEAFNEVVESLMGMDDQVAQNEAGVALFGTKWEDLGVDAVKALTNTNGEIDKTKDKLGEMEDIKYDSLGEMFEQLKRSLELILIPLGEALIPILMNLIEAILPVFEEILPIIGELLLFLSDPLVMLADLILPIILELFTMLISPLMELISNVLPPLIDAFMFMTESVLKPFIAVIKAIFPVLMILMSIFSEVFLGIVTLVAEHMARVTRIFNNFMDFIKNVFTGNWRGAWENIKNIFSDIVGGLGAIFKAPLNAMIDGINGFIKGVNKIKIPDWVPKFGGRSINIPSIPRLKIGMDYVPDDDFPALLHKGEAVLTAEEASIYRGLGGSLESLVNFPSIPNMNMVGSTSGNNDLNSLINAINNLAGRKIVLNINDREFAEATAPAMSKVINDNNKVAAREDGVIY